MESYLRLEQKALLLVENIHFGSTCKGCDKEIFERSKDWPAHIVSRNAGPRSMVIKQVRKLLEKGKEWNALYYWKKEAGYVEKEVIKSSCLAWGNSGSGKKAWKYRSSHTPDVLSAMAGVRCPRSEAP
ncbi:hypothetical protein BSKO_00522 [Bryopsis sp. KO-2023]|nr:hypothetical protein BSKO_00522 [Bryopsis sp. KO-2023]